VKKNSQPNSSNLFWGLVCWVVGLCRFALLSLSVSFSLLFNPLFGFFSASLDGSFFILFYFVLTQTNQQQQFGKDGINEMAKQH